MSFGLHHGIREVTGYDRYFTVQDTHGCSFSHSAVSFSIACEMVALGPALHGLRHGATCYSLLVFHFVLQFCYLQWLSHVLVLIFRASRILVSRIGKVLAQVFTFVWLHSALSFSMFFKALCIHSLLNSFDSNWQPHQPV